MSKHWRPVPPVTTAHQAFLTRLGDMQPHVIRHGLADAVDLDETAEHLQALLGAVADYVGIVLWHVDDNASEPAIGPSRRQDLTERLRAALPHPTEYAFPIPLRDCLADVPGALADVTSDAVAACENAADAARGYYA